MKFSSGDIEGIGVLYPGAVTEPEPTNPEPTEPEPTEPEPTNPEPEYLMVNGML